MHRGSLDDVLDRFLGAIGDHDGPVVRLTADCPLTDPAVVAATCAVRRDARLRVRLQLPPAHASRSAWTIEVCSAAALRAIAAETDDAYDREHVTPALERDPERFRHAALVNGEDLGELRWTVDHEEDLQFVRRVVDRLGDRRHVAGWTEILAAVRAEPSLAAFGRRRG